MFSYFSRSSQIWRTCFVLLKLITFRKSRNGTIGILKKLYLDNKLYDMRETRSKDKSNVWYWYNVATFDVEFVAVRTESTYSSGETL